MDFILTKLICLINYIKFITLKIYNWKLILNRLRLINWALIINLITWKKDIKIY